MTSSVSAPVLGYRAPFFSLKSETYWIINLLKELGFIYDSSFFPFAGRKLMGRTSPDVFQYPNGIYEIPITVGSLADVHFLPVSGGYFRLFPYPLSRWIIKKHVSHYGQAVMAHHNYDFFDSPLCMGSHSLPRVINNLGHWVRLFICSRSCGLNARTKFHRLLQDFDLCPLSRLLPTQPLKGTTYRLKPVAL